MFIRYTLFIITCAHYEYIVVTEETKYKKDTTEITTLDTTLDAEKLRRGDSGLLDFQLLCYLKVRKAIVLRELAQHPADAQPERLLENLKYIRDMEGNMLQKGKLKGYCYQVSTMLAMAQQISALPRDENNNNKAIDTTEQIRRDINLILSWDGSEAQLANKTSQIKSPTTTIDTQLTSEKIPHQETLEDVLERIFSYIFNAFGIRQLRTASSSPISFALEVADSKGRIFKQANARQPTAVFYCATTDALSQVLEKFLSDLLSEKQPIALGIQPFYNNKEISLIGHKIILYKENHQVHIQDQTTDKCCAEMEYLEIADAIFSTRRKLYMENLGAKGFVLEFQPSNPLIELDEKLPNSSAIPDTKTNIKYPSIQDTLSAQSKLTAQEKGALLLSLMSRLEFNNASYLLKQSDINVNVIDNNARAGSCLLIAIKHNQSAITNQLLKKGAIASIYVKDSHGFDALDYLFTRNIKLEDFIAHAYIKDMPDYAEKIGNDLLAYLLEACVQMAQGKSGIPHSSFEKTAGLANNLINHPHENNRSTVFDMLKDLLVGALGSNQLNIVAATLQYFNFVLFNYPYFVKYILSASPQNQYTALSDILAINALNKGTARDIQFFTLDHGLKKNRPLVDAMLRKDPGIINLTNAKGDNLLHLVVAAKKEEPVQFLLQRTCISPDYISQVYQSIVKREFDTTENIKIALIRALNRRTTESKLITPALREYKDKSHIIPVQSTSSFFSSSSPSTESTGNLSKNTQTLIPQSDGSDNTLEPTLLPPSSSSSSSSSFSGT